MVRAFAIPLVAGALTLGSVDRLGSDRTQFQADGYTVLTADLHVHAFPGDGVLPAWELRKEAARRGLDVIAITNHNQSIAARLPAGGGGRLPLVIPGQEITTPTFHLIAIGIRRAIDWRLPLRDAIAAVHAAGGVAIAAHPVKKYWRMAEDDSGLDLLDGAEAVVKSGVRFDRGRLEIREFYERTRRRNPDLAPIGSSDFHTIAPLGACRTYLFVRHVSEEGVLEAIRNGRTVAVGEGNRMVGDSRLVDRLRGVVEAPSAPGPLARLAALLALAGLALVVCVR
ncbi:MAG TPA: CehA/McbA family metallohydrolase [Vicinamibacterales bacterium]|jgi:predicted metal-dependent phosphoesterase TrpH|nr:CehA/McbA family metallohydrolase [Vicinamibacterales bacterium]